MSLAADGLAFGYPGRAVGRDASFALREGAVTALLGPNGCGKTTLFRTLLGLLPPRAGRVLLDGADLRGRPRAAVARRLAYVPQAHATAFPYTALDVVLMGRTVHLGPFGTPSARDRAAALAALESLGVADLADAELGRVSGGQRQLVLIARALAQEAGFVVMDEPTSGLDLGNQALVLARLRGLAAAGLGVLLSTHAPDHALACADRVLLMREGRIVADGPADEAITRERMRAVYGVAVHVGRLPGAGRVVCVPEFAGTGDAAGGGRRDPAGLSGRA